MKSATQRKPMLADTSTMPTMPGLPNPVAVISAIPDPLRLALANMRYGSALFEAVNESDWKKAGGEGAVIEATYGAPLDVLEAWDAPALTVEGAIEALEFVLQEIQNHGSPHTTRTMVVAALAYLKASKRKA